MHRHELWKKRSVRYLSIFFVALTLALYFWAFFRPGLWLRDAFLYRQADGSFAGRDAYAAYTMQISQINVGTDVSFALDGETRHYRIETAGGSDLKIYQDGTLVFAGEALGSPGDALLWRGDDGGLADEVHVIVNGEYQKADLWPSCTWLYNVSVGGRRETRGSVAFLLPMGALAVLLVLDVRFPLLFWNLRHGFEVSGGEPTDWYYTMQKVSRIASVIGIFVLAAMSFAVH